MEWGSIQFDWNRTRAFLIVAEEGSLSAAARSLNMTQPTLGRQITALEQELNVTLFEQVGKRQVLTLSGQKLVGYVKQMAEAANQLSLMALAQRTELSGLVTVSVSQLDAVFRIPPVVRAIRQIAPDIELRIDVSNDVADLKRREADIAIRNFRPEQGDLITRKIADEPIGLYCSPLYAERFPGVSQLKDIRHADFIGYDLSSSVRDHLRKLGGESDTYHFPIISQFQLLHIELAKLDQGLIFLPTDIGYKIPELTSLLPEVEPVMEIPVWLVCHRELRTNPGVNLVFDTLANALF
ncbi:LysR family transcriptional regulator [Saccharospirillum impatiens]|uniref:LysR family transcriptional regulator n=1 Tax=Saccharospirillum impatiens TaxID=169438 RepID=UPI0004048655|nr:LysR family transcriptional regulator [Saccharospirillum impatiens]